MVSSFRKVRRLSADERRLLAQALVLLPLTLCGVYALGVSRWQRVLSKLTTFRRPSVPDSHLPENRSSEDPTALRDNEATTDRARVIARIVGIAAHHGLYRARCLQQALVLSCLLKRHSIESEIRFGTRKEEGKLQAHAWVEVDRLPLNEGEGTHQGFSPFDELAISKII